MNLEPETEEHQHPPATDDHVIQAAEEEVKKLTFRQKVYNNKLLSVLVTLVLFSLAFLTAAAIGYFSNKDRYAIQINSYEECASLAGSRIQESYPETCVTKNGQRFVRQLPSTTPTPTASEICEKGFAPLYEGGVFSGCTLNTTNWETYTDNETGIVFKYPNWRINNEEKVNGLLIVEFEVLGSAYYYERFTLEASPNNPQSMGTKVLNGITWDWEKGKLKYDCSTQECVVHYTTIDDYYYSFYGPSDTPTLVDQILSTFEFLDSSDSNLQVWWGQINESQNLYVVVGKDFKDIPTSIEYEENETNAKFGPYTMSKISEDEICPQLITNHWDVYRTDDFPGFDSFDYTRLITVNLINPDGIATAELTNTPGICQSAAY